MRVQLAYGEQGLTVDLPDDRTTVVEPRYVPAAEDSAAALGSALREPVVGLPLCEIVRPGQEVAISVCDGTRAQPRDLMVPAVLDELAGTVDLDDVVILVATGAHRATPRPNCAACWAKTSSTGCTSSTTTRAMRRPWFGSAPTATACLSG